MMTRQELEKYDEWKRRILFDGCEEKWDMINRLATLNKKYGDRHSWASSFQNMKGLIGTYYEQEAVALYEKIQEYDGMERAVKMLAKFTDDFGREVVA